MGRAAMRRMLVAIAVIAGSSANASITTAQSFSLVISTPHPAVQAGDRIQVDVVLRNITDHAILRPSRSPDPICDYRIQVESKSGMTSSEPDCIGPRPIPFTRSPQETLKPQETVLAHISLTRDLNKLTDLDFSVPGNYVVQVSHWDSGSAQFVKSNKITVKVSLNSAPQ